MLNSTDAFVDCVEDEPGRDPMWQAIWRFCTVYYNITYDATDSAVLLDNNMLKDAQDSMARTQIEKTYMFHVWSK